MSKPPSSSSTMTETSPAEPSYFKVVLSQTLITDEVLHYQYQGKGIEDDPYVVEFIRNDPRNPVLFSTFRKWFITSTLAFATLAISFNSSAYSGGAKQIVEAFNCTQLEATLGVSIFVLGFAIGPLLWGPLSEMYGRQLLFTTTYAAMTVCNAGAAGAHNIQTLLVLRFFAGAFGSSPLTNAGGVIADMFSPKERGLAMALFSMGPFTGPLLGPICGGFMAQNPTVGFRWLLGLLAIFSASVWLMGTLLVPETYAPVILRARAEKLSKLTGKIYVSKLDIGKGKPSIIQLFQTALSRPWILLFYEPVVAITAVYIAIIYGTLYMSFAAYPIVFQQERGWSQGIGGLAFVGVAIGTLVVLLYVIPDNKRFEREEDAAIARGDHGASPESRLPPIMVGACLIPIGLFWFAWTNGPEIHWASSIAAGIPFGMGMILVMLGTFNYLIDTYTIYAASVLAANSILRSLFGFAFPLFARDMYDGLGIHWASSIPAFLALACVPAPFLFWKYGAIIRRKQKYSKEAMRILDEIRAMEHGKRGENEPSAVEAKHSDEEAGEIGDTLEVKSQTTSSEDSHKERDIEKGLA